MNCNFYTCSVVRGLQEFPMYIALPCELNEKLTGTTVRGYFLKIEIDSHATPIFHTFFIRVREGDYNRRLKIPRFSRTGTSSAILNSLNDDVLASFP